MGGPSGSPIFLLFNPEKILSVGTNILSIDYYQSENCIWLLLFPVGKIEFTRKTATDGPFQHSVSDKEVWY
jgi:hypothetical protein